jgi:hypothetical protein
MQRQIVLIAFLIALTAALAAGQPSPSDSSRYRNYGPYEARGSVSPPTRSIPFHQHLWKVVEYPTEAAVRVASLPFIGAARITGVDYRSGHLMQLFYFDHGRGYLFPSAEIETDRDASASLRIFHDSPAPLLSSGTLGLKYGGKREHSVDASLSISQLFIGGWSRSRPDHYIYVGDEAMRFTLKDRVAYSRLSLGIRSEITAGFVASYRYSYAEQRDCDCSTSPASEVYDEFFRQTGSEERWGAGTEIVFDTRANGDHSPSGWLASGAATRVWGARSADVDYWRSRAEIRRHLHVYAGNRFLSLGARANGVRRIDDEQVPFWELPTLGGDRYLRGFSVDRFRDYVAVVFSAQYSYPIFQGFRGLLFADFGSTASAWRAFELDRFRTGYGMELSSRLDRNFLFRFQLAHSRDGLRVYLGASTTVDLELAEGLL